MTEQPASGQISEDRGEGLVLGAPAPAPATASAVRAEAQAAVGSKPALRWHQGISLHSVDPVLGECPVALCFNGVSHAVMMATPADLEDFALGFSLTEGILDSASQLYSIECNTHAAGIELSLQIATQAFVRLKRRRRQLSGPSGCGLCGIESLEQLAPSSSMVVDTPLRVEHEAIQRALIQLPTQQSLQRETGAAHAAAWCDPRGEILALREDVGRHNALDKLLGAHHRAGYLSHGFVLVTSRASYEMVLKVASCGLPMLVAVSAPTALAVDYALAAHLTLVGFARPGRHQVYAGEERLA